MAEWKAFVEAQDDILKLDGANHPLSSEPMVRTYRKRNSFGLSPEKKIHRIFRRDFLDMDIARGVLTLPLVSAGFWKDTLENPLSRVSGPDSVTGHMIDFGNLVRDFHGLCWTRRSKATPADWSSFADGGEPVRISTTVGKLLDRVMVASDPHYMHRTWLVEVEYLSEKHIKDMQTPGGVLDRLESSGALLAYSAATVNAKYMHEDEVRLLYSAAFPPLPLGVIRNEQTGLIQIPFDWNGVIESKENAP